MSAANPHFNSIHERFDAVAKNNRDKVALVQGEESLCYGELADRSVRLARELACSGVENGTCIGITGALSIKTIVDMLAILRLGAHFIYVDERQPPAFVERLKWTAGVKRILGGPNDQSGPRDVELPRVSSSNPAYIIFSSGSTGAPKAIQCVHAGVLRLCSNQDFLKMDGSLCMLVASSLSFDASVFEIWAPLLNGGSCVLHDGSPLTTELLKEYARVGGVNTIWLTSALFNTLVDLDPSCFQDIQNVLTGGDVVSISHMRRAFKHNTSTRFINGYGPTENTVFTTCHVITRENLSGMSLPIGRAIHGTGLLICDDSLDQVAPGQTGELIALGDGLATGYLKNDELNQERFIEVVVSGRRQRAYRTGDLVYEGRDGLIWFHGRKDRQVKINGFRFDAAETEEFLRRREGVGDAAVLVADHYGTRLLFFAASVRNHADRAQVQQSVAELLPSYFQPHGWIFMDELPLTSNGKVDREKILSDWESCNRLQLPRSTEYEMTLAQAWAQFTGCQPSAEDRAFTKAGGNSLLAVRFVAHLNQAFGLVPQIGLNEFYVDSRFTSIVRLVSERATKAPVNERQHELTGWAEANKWPVNPYQRSMILHELIHDDRSSNSLFYVVHELESATDNQLHELQRALLAAFPTLRSRVAMHGDDFALEAVAIESSIVQDFEDHPSLREFGLRHVSREHSVFEAGMLAFIVGAVDGRRTVGLWIHHLVADVFFVERLFSIIAGTDGLCRNSDDSIKTYCEQSKALESLIRESRSAAESFWRAQMLPQTPSALVPHSSIVDVRVCHLSSARAQLLVRNLGQAQVSLTAFFAAVLARALKCVLPEAGVSILATFSQRFGHAAHACEGFFTNLVPLPSCLLDALTASKLANLSCTLEKVARHSFLPYEEISASIPIDGAGLSALLNIVPVQRAAWRKVMRFNDFKSRRALTLTVYVGDDDSCELVVSSKLGVETSERIEEAILQALAVGEEELSP